jgi:hypothetical protein
MGTSVSVSTRLLRREVEHKSVLIGRLPDHEVAAEFSVAIQR